MFAFAFSVTAPIFLMVLLGVVLKRGRVIDDAFIVTVSKLIYMVGLPTLLFISSATSDFTQMADMRLLMAFGVMTLVVFFFAQATAHWHVQHKQDVGVFVQGAFRGNLVILGLAFCANAYGPRGVAIAALPVAMTVVMYNFLSVYTLSRSLESENGFGKTVKGIVRNPLLIAIALGLVVNAVGLPLPKLLLDSGSYLGQMVLPLALICIGGALNLKQLHRVDRVAAAASVWKLLVSPLLACTLAIGLGVRGENLAILFLLAASPTATVSFAMVQAIGGNATLAANIIVQTTLASLLTVTLGLWLLQVCQLL
jgi:hypothetical protein